MIRVLTAFGSKHAELLERLKKSIPGEVRFTYQWDHNHGKAYAMDLMFDRIDDDDICLLCDADDWFLPSAFSPERLKWLETYDLIYGDCFNAGKDVRAYVSRGFDREELRVRNYIPYSTVVTKGWLLKKERYPTEKHVGDWIYWNKLLRHTNKFAYIRGIVTYRDVTTSYYASNIPVYRKIKRILRDNNARKIISKL